MSWPCLKRWTPSASYPTITVTVNVAANAAASVTNSATVATALDTGAGNNTANDPTTVNPVGATDVGAQVVVNNTGAPVYNRGISRWVKTVTIQNTGAALSNAAIALDSLAAGWTLTNGDGVTTAVAPLGSPYKIVGAIGSGSTVSVQLQFTKTGAVPLTFTSRVLEGTPR